jgi:hypothetical protein
MSELPARAPLVALESLFCTPLALVTREGAVGTLLDVLNEVVVFGSPVPLRNVSPPVAFRLLRADGGVIWSIFFCIAEILALEASSVDSTFRLSGSCKPRQHIDRQAK